MVHTLTNPNKKRSVVQSMIMQINCKLGGSLWMVPIPLRNTMIAGIDTFHDAKNRSKSVSAFSASIDPIFTKWYSKSIVQERGEELGHGLTMGLSGALKAYRACNNKLPERIVIYRWVTASLMIYLAVLWAIKIKFQTFLEKGWSVGRPVGYVQRLWTAAAASSLQISRQCL